MLDIVRDILIGFTGIFAIVLGFVFMTNAMKWHRRERAKRTVSMRGWVEKDGED